MKLFSVKLTVLFLFIFTLVFSVFSQSSSELIEIQKLKIQKIEKELKPHIKDSTYVNQISELSRLYSTIYKFEKATELATSALLLSQKINYSRGEASAYSSLGSIYHDNRQYKKSKKTLLIALKKCKENNQEEDMTFVYRFLGEASLKLGDTTNAIYFHKEGLELCKKLKIMNRIGFAHDFLGYIYFHQNNYNQAIEHFSQSLAVFENLNMNHRIALAAGNIGLSYINLNVKRKSVHFLTIASKHYELDNNIKGHIWMNSLLSNIYKDIGEFTKARTYNGMNQSIYVEQSNEVGIASCYREKGEIAMASYNYKEAHEDLQKALRLFEDNEHPIGKARTLARLGELFYLKGEYTKAVKYLKKGKKLAEDISHKKIQEVIEIFQAAIYIKQGEVEKGKNLLEKSLAYYKNESKTSRYLPFIYQNLAFSDSILGDYASSLNNYKLFVHHFQLENKDKFDTRIIAYQTEYEKKEAVANALLENEKTQRKAALMGLFLLSTLIVVLIYLFRSRTKRHKIEKENVELQKREILRIKEVEQFKSTFLTNITHEFRTPLTLIKGHIEVMKENNDPTIVNQLNEMNENSDRLLHLINQLIDLSIMESGSYIFKYCKGDLIKTLQASVQAFHSLAERLEIELNFAVDKSIGFVFDSSQFIYSKEAVVTVVSNLLSNAFKFTPKGGSVDVFINVLNTETLVIEVKDSGIGISTEELDYIFNRYHQIDTPTHNIQEGSGIGLAIVKEIATLHDGDVLVESEMNKGTTFTVKIKQPVNSSDVIIVENEVYNEMNSMSQQINNQVLSSDIPIILVVEDQPELRRFIVDNLDGNYQFIEASNGREGIELAEKFIPDLIISDVMMPDTDGLKLCSYLKSSDKTSHIPIILLTAKSQQANRLEGLELGADDYIVKPFSLAEIRLRVKNLLRIRELFRNKFAHSTVLSSEDKAAGFTQKESEFIEKLESIILSNISNQQFGVPILAEELSLSASQLTRKLKSLINQTPAMYIKNMRFEKAKSLLLDGFNVSETAWEIGYEDPGYFSKEFKKHFGEAPSFIKK